MSHDTPTPPPSNTVPSTAPGSSADPAPRSPGEARRRQVMGDAFVDRALAGADAFSRPLQDYVNEHA